MSRTGCCYDNAPMESFFHTLKVELVHQRRWATRDDARRDLFADIEGYDNRKRIHSALGYITPEQAERNASYPPVRAIGKGSPRAAERQPRGGLDAATGAGTAEAVSCAPVRMAARQAAKASIHCRRWMSGRGSDDSL